MDPDTGLHYSNARWYDPELGRFITEDPIKDGLNWYAYCGNNPVNYVDPTGLKLKLKNYSRSDLAPDGLIKHNLAILTALREIDPSVTVD